MSILPYIIATLQLSASAVYVYNGHYRLAVIWFGVSLSNAALAGTK